MANKNYQSKYSGAEVDAILDIAKNADKTIPKKTQEALDEKLNKNYFTPSDYGSYNLVADNKYTTEIYKCDLFPHVKRVGLANNVARLVVPAEFVINDDYTMKQGDKIILIDAEGISHTGYVDSIEQRVDDPGLYNINGNYDGLDFNGLSLSSFQESIVKANFYSGSELELEYKLKKAPDRVSDFLNDAKYLNDDTIYDVIEKMPKGTAYEGVLTYTPKGDDTEISISTSDVLRAIYEIDASTSIHTLRLVFDATYGGTPYQIYRAFENYGELSVLFKSDTQSHRFNLYRATLRQDGLLYDFNFGTDDEETIELIKGFANTAGATDITTLWTTIVVDTTTSKNGYYEWKKNETFKKGLGLDKVDNTRDIDKPLSRTAKSEFAKITKILNSTVDDSILLYNPLRFNADPKTDLFNTGASRESGHDTVNIIVNLSKVPEAVNTVSGDTIEFIQNDGKALSFSVLRAYKRDAVQYCVTIIDDEWLIRDYPFDYIKSLYKDIKTYRQGYEWMDKSKFITSSKEYQELKQAIINLGGTI